MSKSKKNSKNAFEIIEDFISKRELICPIEFRAWQTLKTDILANNKLNAPLCDCEQLFIGCAITGVNCTTHGITKCT